MTPLVLLTAKLNDVGADDYPDSAKVKVFRLTCKDAVGIYADTLHFCPCEVIGNVFGCVAMLPEDTNMYVR